MKTTNLFQFIGLLILLGCHNSQKERVRDNLKDSISVKSYRADLTSFDNYDTISFSLIKDSSNAQQYKLNIPTLDSLSKIKWTDKYMPKELVNKRLYSAFLLSNLSKIHTIEPKVIYTAADDWGRLHLITCMPDSTLIAFKEIGEQGDHLIESNNEYEKFVVFDAQLIKKSQSEYIIRRIEKLTIDFIDQSLKDSTILKNVDSIFVIDNTGKINYKPQP